jgi:hypothetical protein
MNHDDVILFVVKKNKKMDACIEEYIGMSGYLCLDLFVIQVIYCKRK